MSPFYGWLPSGKHTKNCGKSPFLMGKSTISMAIFNSKLLVYQRVLGWVLDGVGFTTPTNRGPAHKKSGTIGCSPICDLHMFRTVQKYGIPSMLVVYQENMDFCSVTSANCKLGPQF
jgi:hypothetical protein